MTNWKKRYLASQVRWAAVASHAPQRGLVSTNQHGSYQLYAWDIPTNGLRQITHDPTGVANGDISADGQWVYYHQDQGGNEIGHYMRLPWAGGPAENITPALPPYSSWNLTSSADGCWLGFSAADSEGFRVWLLPSDLSQPPRPLFHSPHLTFGPQFSADGQLAYLLTSLEGNLDMALLALDTETGAEVGRVWDGAGTNMEFGPSHPVPGQAWLAVTSNAEGIERPFLWNPLTAERREILLGDLPGAISIWAWAADGSAVLLGQLHAAQQTLYRYDLADDTLHPLTEAPAGVFSGWRMRWTAEDELILTGQDAEHPAQLLALDGRTGALRRVLIPSGEVPAGRPWRSVSLRGAKGEMVQGWLMVPEGAGPFPTILHTHGGPTAVMLAYFFPEAQAWVDHGYAFFTLNYHGSTTFGKAFEQAIWGHLGDLEVADMAASQAWLVEQGVAHPNQIFVAGGSYGGYLTLHALGKRPELWAGGVATVAIADWGLMYEDQAENLRGYQRALFGGTPQETAEATRLSSPITYAEQVRAPILVIQGRNDTRCPARQMAAYEQRLRELGLPIEVHWFEAGHGAIPQTMQIEHQQLALDFVRGVLDARP